MWVSLFRLSPGKRYRAETLRRAYGSVFDSPEGQLVLADLAAECGMYQAPPVTASERECGFNDGRKALFARILEVLRIPPEEHAALQAAARLETVSPHIDQQTED